MQRKDVIQILEDPLAQELMNAPIISHLAYIGLDGTPRVIPIGYYWNGEQFVIGTASNAPRVRALATSPKVALTTDTDTQPPHILLVRGTASIEIIDGVIPEYLQASQKYIVAQQWPAFEAQVRALYKQMARITIVPEWAKLLDFETRLPSAIEALAH